MGKGDRKTKKGKIVKGTFGVRRPKKKKTAHQPPAEEKKEKSKK
jgi:30S ribosomal protein S31